jgi:hypothetical protein
LDIRYFRLGFWQHAAARLKLTLYDPDISVQQDMSNTYNTYNTMAAAMLYFMDEFPTAQALFAWLRSDVGGRFMVREAPEMPLAMIYYQKGVTDMTVPHAEWFRSVVWDAEAHRPVCCGPSRGRKFAEADAENIPYCMVEDFVDGVMINMFHYAGAWRLATRTVLGANNSFYGKRAFGELFWETFDSVGLSTEMLDPYATYSWVLQHPEERIVVATAFGIPRLTLVESTDPRVKYAQSDSTEPLVRFCPKRYKLSTLEDVKQCVVDNGQRFGPGWQGLVIKGFGRRWKLRSVEYDEARSLRGNQAKLPYLWLERWSAGRLTDYLSVYPEEALAAESVIETFKAATKEAHSYYLQIWREHAMPLGQAPHKYRKLLWEAHEAGKGAYFPHFRQFMNDQDTARKLWLVNYDQRSSVSA